MHSAAGDVYEIPDFKIGQRVWLRGTKPGFIKFIGKTQFAPGVWAGVILDEPVGKNDGSVGGVKYFSCEPQRGIFARPQKLTRSPGTVTGIGDSSLGAATPKSGVLSPSSKTVTLYVPLSASKGICSRLRLSERVTVSSSTGVKTGTLRFIGETDFAKSEWAGVELDEPVGKNDGSVAGKRISRAGGSSVYKASSIRGGSLGKSRSKVSLNSSVNNASRSSKVKLGVTSLTSSTGNPSALFQLVTKPKVHQNVQKVASCSEARVANSKEISLSHAECTFPVNPYVFGGKKNEFYVQGVQMKLHTRKKKIDASDSSRNSVRMKAATSEKELLLPEAVPTELSAVQVYLRSLRNYCTAMAQWNLTKAASNLQKASEKVLDNIELEDSAED